MCKCLKLFICPIMFLALSASVAASPFVPPTYDDSTTDFATIPAPALGQVDASEAQILNELIEGCYPTESLFDFDLRLRAGNRSNSFGSDYESSGNFAEIVLEMPLFSSVDNRRELEREFGRRQAVARTVTQFLQAINATRHDERMIDLYRALESRSRDRIFAGVAGVDEQVTILDKLSRAHEARQKDRAEAIEAKLILLNHCTSADRKRVSRKLDSYKF